MSLKALIIHNPLVRYVRESKEELEKVEWPTRKTVHLYALMVIALCVFLGAFFFVLDLLFGKGLAALVSCTS